MALVRHYKDLRVYQLGFEAAMRVFRLSKNWPLDERFALTSQIRNSSRSVCGSIAEAWRKRRYPNHFVSKLSDADSEAAETQNWLDFARECEYLSETDHAELWVAYDKIAQGLVLMMTGPATWCGPSSLVREDTPPYDITSDGPND
jgi:four helix bundle protein